jgi:hypothetical protein
MVADLKLDTLRQYTSALRSHHEFCRRKGLVPATPSAIENHLRSMWDRGILNGSPFTLRSAMRKACFVQGRPDPFDKRLDMFVDAFSTDRTALEARFIEPAHLDMMKARFASYTDKKLIQASLLFMITLNQNLRMRTLLSMTFNDLMPESGAIWIAHAKKHNVPFLTIAHPLMEEAVSELYVLMGSPPPQTRLAEGWTGVELNDWLGVLALQLKLPYSPTWHWIRHSATQRMNDLGYWNPIMRALGTWKSESSMKTYIRCRKPFPYPLETVLKHKWLIETLSARLQQHRGKMLRMAQPKTKARVAASLPPLHR